MKTASQKSPNVLLDNFRVYAFYFPSLFTKISPLCCLFLLISPVIISAQDFPKEIRGYKVYNAKISVENQDDKPDAKADAQAENKSEAFVKIGEPEIVDVSLTGITLELSAEIKAAGQSGAVDFITFKDFTVNGLAVDVEEYKEPFSFRKNQPISLPKPFKFSLGARETIRGALKEIRGAKDEWTVTGMVFVFGRFKKFGFDFKRVVPIGINLKIKNPLKNAERKPIIKSTI